MFTIQQKEALPPKAMEILDLLSIFPALRLKQAELFLMQRDDLCSKENAESIIELLCQKKITTKNNGILSLTDNDEIDKAFENSFWLLLQYAKNIIGIDYAKYPAEIIFYDGNVINEILYCSNDDIIEKMTYLYRRKKYHKLKENYFIIIDSDTIDELDDDLYPNASFSIITINGYDKNDIPIFVYHDVITSQMED